MYTVFLAIFNILDNPLPFFTSVSYKDVFLGFICLSVLISVLRKVLKPDD